MRASNGGRNAGQTRSTLASEALVPPRLRGAKRRAVEKVIEVTPQGWADRGAGCAARPLRWCKKEGNGRLRRVGTEGAFALRARPHATGTMHDTPFEHFAVAHGDIEGGTRPAPAISRQKTDNTRHCATVGSVGGLRQCHGALQASFGPSTEPRFKAHNDHPLALQLEGAVGLGHQHLDDGAGAPVAERVELAVGERNGRGGSFGSAGSGGGAVSFVIVVLLGGLMRIRRPPIMDPCRRSSDDEAAGPGRAARPLQFAPKEENGRRRRVGIDGLAPSASHTTG